MARHLPHIARASVYLVLFGFAAVLLAGCQTNLVNEVVNFWSLGCCGAVAIILDIVALIELAGRKGSTGRRVLWALLIIFAPYLGCVLYFLFGR